MDAGAEQGFGGVDVADAHDDALIHQEVFDRCAAACGSTHQIRGVKLVVERLGAEMGEQLMGLAGGLPEQGAESAWIGKAQHGAILQMDIDVIVRARRGVLRQHAQAAGHAQMHDGATALGIEQQIFGAAAGSLDALAGQYLGDFRRNGPAQVGATQGDIGDASPDDVRCDAASGGFHFGQFRHTLCSEVGEAGIVACMLLKVTAPAVAAMMRRRENPMREMHWRALAPSSLLLAAVAALVPLGTAQAQTRADYLRRFDSDGDGRVSLSEYQDYMSHGFHAMDRNGDRVLSADELPSGVRTRTATTLDGHRRAVARMFDVLDANNDGFLDANELTAPPR